MALGNGFNSVENLAHSRHFASEGSTQVKGWAQPLVAFSKAFTYFCGFLLNFFTHGLQQNSKVWPSWTRETRSSMSSRPSPVTRQVLSG